MAFTSLIIILVIVVVMSMLAVGHLSGLTTWDCSFALTYGGLEIHASETFIVESGSKASSRKKTSQTRKPKGVKELILKRESAPAHLKTQSNGTENNEAASNGVMTSPDFREITNSTATGATALTSETLDVTEENTSQECTDISRIISIADAKAALERGETPRCSNATVTKSLTGSAEIADNAEIKPLLQCNEIHEDTNMTEAKDPLECTGTSETIDPTNARNIQGCADVFDAKLECQEMTNEASDYENTLRLRVVQRLGLIKLLRTAYLGNNRYQYTSSPSHLLRPRQPGIEAVAFTHPELAASGSSNECIQEENGVKTFSDQPNNDTILCKKSCSLDDESTVADACLLETSETLSINSTDSDIQFLSANSGEAQATADEAEGAVFSESNIS